jgi:formate-dependent phosphoribosylglycinamide formyltransferase (GAR transformylase)
MNKLEEELHQLGYGLRLSKLTDAQHNAATERRVASIEAKDARIAELKEALKVTEKALRVFGAKTDFYRVAARVAREALKGEDK